MLGPGIMNVFDTVPALFTVKRHWHSWPQHSCVAFGVCRFGGPVAPPRRPQQPPGEPLRDDVQIPPQPEALLT